MKLAHLVLCASAVFALSLPTFAQEDDGSPGETPIPIDTTERLDPDSSFFNDIEGDNGFDEPVEPETFFQTRGGFAGGVTVDLVELDPASLDPDLGGTIVQYGAHGYMLLSSWIVGGGGASAVLYDMSTNYDQFIFGYGGFLTGYDTRAFYGALSIRGSVLIGAGGLELLKRRPEFVDSSGNEILERYRDEGFFLLRPGVSIGYAPLPFLEFRIGVNYLFPIGGERVKDLRTLTYGLQVNIGLGD